MADWDSCANRHLLAHILKAGNRKKYYCHPSDAVYRVKKTQYHPLTVEVARVLRAHAHCWALDMADNKYPPPAPEQRAAWVKAMEQADAEIQKLKDQEEDAVPPH